MQKIRYVTSIPKFTFFLYCLFPCLIKHNLALCGVKKKRISLNFRANKKSPHGGRRIGNPKASMRGFFVSSKIKPDSVFFNTAYFWWQNPDFNVKVAWSNTFIESYPVLSVTYSTHGAGWIVDPLVDPENVYSLSKKSTFQGECWFWDNWRQVTSNG